LIGYNNEYAKKLSKFSCVHVRISIKGTNSLEYSILTEAIPESFNLQLEALKNLLDAGVSCHPAVMLSFTQKENLQKFLGLIGEIDVALIKEVEEEYVFLYPNVIQRLEKAGIRPLVAYTPNHIPCELV